MRTLSRLFVTVWASFESHGGVQRFSWLNAKFSTFRYTEELHPYKYAGYPMLVKTIRMETDDDKLFSKSAPLLAAASECAFYTVKCSALNAEELRR